jgi:hypothetical protein
MRSVSILLASTFLSTSAIIAPAALTPAAAQIDFNINIGAPPAAQYELVPAPRPGYAWAQGYWQVENNRYVWAPGRWMEARQDQHWVPDRWESYREGGQEKWRHQPGSWDRDEHRGPTEAARPDHDDHRGPTQAARPDHDEHRGPTQAARPDHDDHRGPAQAARPDHDDHHGPAHDAPSHDARHEADRDGKR